MLQHGSEYLLISIEIRLGRFLIGSYGLLLFEVILGLDPDEREHIMDLKNYRLREQSCGNEWRTYGDFANLPKLHREGQSSGVKYSLLHSDIIQTEL